MLILGPWDDMVTALEFNEEIFVVERFEDATSKQNF
jgi:hypothetical protein